MPQIVQSLPAGATASRAWERAEGLADTDGHPPPFSLPEPGEEVYEPIQADREQQGSGVYGEIGCAGPRRA
jgi:hypothetical protein